MNLNICIEKVLSDLASSNFWGEVTIRYSDGVPTLLFKHEQFKLQNNQEVMSRKNRRDFHEPSGASHGKHDATEHE